jgi:DNA-binding CsgD family transcriptional regulator
VRDRLTPKEMRIVALIVQGCKNREIATRLKTTEQVIKNYLRSIYDKTGVGDRLELALFTIHHRVLARPRPKWAASWKPRPRRGTRQRESLRRDGVDPDSRAAEANRIANLSSFRGRSCVRWRESG